MKINGGPESTLYVVSTPIGNLEDISFRAVRILGEVDVIAAEDTRRTVTLLNHYGIKGRLESYHDHNKEKKTPSLLKRLHQGHSIAIVSDAGTPGISDPAFYLVREAVRRGITVIPIPGASAALAGLVVSGLPTDRFVFEGFLPPKKGRNKRLESLKDEVRTIVLYESPHRMIRTLEDLVTALGDRPAVVAREITKKFEEHFRGSLHECLQHVSRKKIQGEYVIIIQGQTKKVTV